MQERRPVGIKQLAADLGISIGTVSRALNGRGDVNSQTRARVLDAARRLGYAANHSGRSLRQGSTGTIGVLWRVADSRETYGEPFFVALFDGLQSELTAAGRDLVVLMTEGRDQLDRVRRVVERGLVDALILPWTQTDDPRLDYVAERGFPFVALGRSRSGGRHPWIDLDFGQAGERAIGRLLGFGHRHVGIVTPNVELMQGAILVEGCRAALAGAGVLLAPFAVAAQEMTEAGGYAAAQALFAAAVPPTAIVTINDRMAVGIYRFASERGMAVGRDLAVIAVSSDSALCRYLTPALTCFEASTFDLGQRLARLTLDRLAGEAAADTGILWPMQLVARESDALPRGGSR